MRSSPSLRPNWFFGVLLVAALVFVAAGRLRAIPALTTITTTGYEWILLLAAAAFFLGVINVLWLHVRRIALGQRDWGLSLILVAVLLAVAAGGLLNPAGAASPLLGWIFANLIAPGQAALFAMLIFFMAAAAFQYLRIGRPGGAWMLAGALLILVVQMPIAGPWLPPWLSNLAQWWLDVPGMAALRGLLLGGGLAMLVVGLRMLVGRV